MKIILYPAWNVRFFCQDKNASTTLFQFFKESHPGDSLVHWDSSTRNAKAPFNRPRVEVCGPNVAREFTVVRNTWSRIESLFFMLRNQFRGGEAGIPEGHFHSWFDPFSAQLHEIFGGDETFARFIAYICSFDDDDCDSHWQPQALSLPLRSPCFRVLRMENLSADFDRYLSDVLPISLDDAEARNVREKSPVDRSLWEQRLIDLVGNRYEHEISLFGFSPPPILQVGDR